MRATTEKDIQTMNRLFECRRAAKSILREKYDERMEEWRGAIREGVRRSGKVPLQVALALSGDSDGMVVLLLMAAAVDVIEEGLAQ
jgi:hypothetical protein